MSYIPIKIILVLITLLTHHFAMAKTSSVNQYFGVIQISQNEVCQNPPCEPLVFLLDNQMQPQYQITGLTEKNHHQRFVRVSGQAQLTTTKSALPLKMNVPQGILSAQTIEVIDKQAYHPRLVKLADSFMQENFPCIRNWSKTFSWSLDKAQLEKAQVQENASDIADFLTWSVTMAPSWLSDEKFKPWIEKGSYIRLDFNDKTDKPAGKDINVESNICDLL